MGGFGRQLSLSSVHWLFARQPSSCADRLQFQAPVELSSRAMQALESRATGVAAFDTQLSEDDSTL